MGLRRLLPALAAALLVAPLGAQGGFAPLALAWERAAAATAAGEYEPAVAVAPDGTTVVVWWEPFGEFNQVRFSVYDVRGAPAVAGGQVAGVVGRPRDLAVATDAAGNFVAGFLSGGLQLHGFTAAGERRPGLRQSLPAAAFGLAVAPDGQVALAWTEQVSDTYTLRLRRLDAGGAQGWTQTVASSAYGLVPAVAVDAAGGAVVAYSHTSADGDDVQHRVRRYDAAGGLSWGHDALDAGTARRFFPPVVATDAGGDSVVAWDGAVTTGSYPDETTEYGALYRRLRADGTSPDSGRPPWLQPGDQTADYLFGARIAAAGAGLFAFAWRDEGELRFARLRFGDGAVQGSYAVASTASAFAIGAGAGHVALAWDDEERGGVDAAPEAGPAQAPAPGVSARLYAPYNSYRLTTSTAGTHEGSGEPVVFTVTRGSAQGESAVGYSLDGTAQLGLDYELADPPAGVVTATGQLRFADGERARRISLRILDDALGEPLKAIVLRLSSPSGLDELSFPVAVVTLGDDDLAEVQIVQTGGSTVVRRGDPPDRLAVALRTVPAHRVVVTLTPSDRRLNLGAGYGVPLRLVFEPDARAQEQQWVAVFTVPGEGDGAGLAANAGIGLGARSADPGYDVGARFTVDGRDLGAIPVELVTRPGESPSPVLPSAYLPMVVR